MHVRRSAEVVVDRFFRVHEFSCLDDHTGWFGDYQDSYQVVLVRKGMFRVRRNGNVSDVDRTVAYLGVPGAYEEYAHAASGEVCTVVTLAPQLWHSMAGDVQITHAYTTARIELAHRRMLAASADPGYAFTEELLALVAGMIGQTAARSALPGRRPSRTDDALVADARAAIAADHPAARRLGSLAVQLGVSPYRLSRAFPRVLGVSLSHYRNRVRVARALDRLEAGEPSLAMLAADLGFADQAHMTRTVRDHLGHTPTALRQILGA